MPRFIAFLRAINVGGHVVKMEELRRHFVAVGCADVETFIASGNVIFTSGARNLAALTGRLESQLRSALGYDVTTVLRTDTEVAAVAAHRPFSGPQLRAAQTLNVAFLSELLGPAARKTVLNFRTDIDDFHVHGREVYWLCKVRQSDSRFTNVRFEKLLDVRATWRNATTITRLAAKYPPSRDG